MPHHEIRGGALGIEQLKAHLTYRPKFAEPDAPPIELFDVTRPGFLGVPRGFGLNAFPDMDVVDLRSRGHAISVPCLPDPNHPKVKDPVAQARFMEDLYQSANDHEGFTAVAATGSGKTVSSLHMAARLGRTTLVLLHLGRLLEQWREEIHLKLGVPANEIGIIRQDECDFEGKSFVVAMGHSLASRGIGGDGYPDALRDYFGTVIVDEVHKFGTAMFAPVMPLFNSYYRTALSATVNRADGGDRVFFWHIGGIGVVSDAEALECDVHTMDYDCGDYPLWGNDKFSRVQSLMRDKARNLWLAGIIKRFYDTGRQALIVSDGVLHLQLLMKLVAGMGVPESALGQFTADHQTLTFVDDPEKPGKKKRKVLKRKFSKAHLDNVQANAQIMFATYGMITEGIDIPRLDAGLDASPRGKATQLIGRIRRPVPGKRRPIWLTARDLRCSISKGLYFARCKDYAASGAEVYQNGRRINTSPQAPHAQAHQRAGASGRVR